MTTDGFPPDTIAGMAFWLLARTGRIRQHPEAAHIAGSITTAVTRALRAIDRPAEGLYAGPCGICGHALYVRPGAVTVICARHDPPWEGDVAARREWMLSETVHVLVHAAAAVHVLGLLGVRVTPVAISRWVADGRLAYRGVDTSGRRLLRLGDIADLASAHAAKAGR